MKLAFAGSLMNYRQRASTLITVMIAIGCLASCGQDSGTDSSAPRPGHVGCSDSKAPVQIVAPSEGGGSPEWRLTIPANYLGNSETWAGGIQQRIRINASFPTLSARPAGTFWSTCSSDAYRQPNPPDPSVWSPDKLDIRIGAGVYRFRLDPKEHVSTASDVSSLSQVQSKCMLSEASNAPGLNCRYVWGYFPTAPAEGGTVSIECRGGTSNPSASCDGVFPFRGRDVEYSFARRELQNWHKYESAARDLLTRFSQ